MTLIPSHNKILKIGSIEARGWLQCQLQLLAENNTGILDEIWPDIKDSAWIGGKGEGWERAPYWLDGLVPLAYALNDRTLKQKVKKWMDYIFDQQSADAWLGPIKDYAYGEKYKAYDPWPVFVFLKAALQYAQVEDDERTVAAALKFVKALHDKILNECPLFDWGKSRWPDLLISIYELYEISGEAWLLDLAQKIKQQGYDWCGHFSDFKFKEKVTDTFGQLTHVVNSAMAVKQGVLWYRISGKEVDRSSILQMLETLDTYHGQVTGVFSGDEHYAGRSPSQGTETCAVVELMYSLEKALEILPDEQLAERLERIAFNALPACLSEDLRWHQYDQQVNQVQCTIENNNIYTNNDPDANCFGLEPNFGCCTANLHQGWPKFVAQLWRKTTDEGLICFSFAPCVVNTNIGSSKVQIEVKGQYPFSDQVQIVIRVDKPCAFPIYLRMPEWMQKKSIVLNSKQNIEVVPGKVFRLFQSWNAEQTIDIDLSAECKMLAGYNNTGSIRRASLVFSLPIACEWKKVESKRSEPLFELIPKSYWQYALASHNSDFSVTRNDMQETKQVFSIENCPLSITMPLAKIKNWQIERGAAATPPEKPELLGEFEKVKLLPYGASKLRVTEFPRI
ncbi:MAG: glycoside hydrolase family 127 protein [Oligoflexales bacterium]|nr:glycoside hydrolase family 127 protein [Oligoflexales bacterium]